MKDIKKILFVVNPISGNNSKDALVEFIKSELERLEIELIVYYTEGENDAQKIKAKIDKLLIDRIFVAGGDGTIKMVAESILEKNIPLGIFPEGSANGLALNLKIPESKESQLNVALGKNILAMDALMINDKLCLHLSDFGVNAELIKNYEEGDTRGKFGYLIHAIPSLLKSNHPYKFEVKMENSTEVYEGVVLIITNCEKYGTGATINPDCSMDDGLFEVIIFKSLDPFKIIKTLSNNSELDSELTEIFRSSSVKINCKVPIPFQIDGEFIGELDGVDVSILKRAIPIAVP